MKAELEKRLRELEPRIYGDGTIRNDGMVFGFQHGDGWYPLIEALITHIKWRIDNPNHVDNEAFDPDRPYEFETNPRRRESRPCFSEDAAGYAAAPDRVVRTNFYPLSPDFQDDEGIFSDEGMACPYSGDARDIRNFTCTDGRMIVTRAALKADYLGVGGIGNTPVGGYAGECPGCEGTGFAVQYRHQCEQPWNHFRLNQVKEKYGTLRFYYHGGDENFQGMVDMAEALSGRMCEACGSFEGTTTEADRGWVRTLCAEHRAERRAKESV